MNSRHSFKYFSLSLVFMTATLFGMLAQSAPLATQKAVLVTGASSGIGRRTTELLASKGYFVYAGARKKKDMEALNTLDNVEAVRLDVTFQDDIDNAVAQITKAGRGLYGVVNNAGVAILAPLVEVEEKNLSFQFDVNVYGPYRITKAFFPLLRESRGRVVNISSISGILTWPMGGGYAMSKHAVEAYSDTLAIEMKKFDIQVAAVEPGNFASRIGSNAKNRARDTGQAISGSLYEAELAATFDGVGNRDGMADPLAVASAVEHALFSETPKARYLVVPNQQEAAETIAAAIQKLVQLNQGQAHSYDRDTLVKMLDQALKAL